MRIGLVVTGGVDASGRERVVPALLWLIERLARRHEVHVFALHYYREPRSYALLGSMVHDLGRVDGPPGLRRLIVGSRLQRAVRACGRFNVLHAYLGMPGAIATKVGPKVGSPVVVTLDSGELVALDGIRYGLQRRWIDRRAMAKTIRDAARVTVATTFMAEMPALGGVRVDIVPIGIDSKWFPLTGRTEGPPWRLLRVGSVNRVKDYTTLLHAFAGLRARSLDVHLDIVGADTLNGSMQALCRELLIDDRVVFHGFQPTAALAAFYSRAHLHVVSSRHEAANVATLEAASCGVPTAGTAVGYVADWAGDGRAVAVPVADPSALAAAIAELLHDPRRRARIGAAARAWTLAHDADYTAAQFERIYIEVRTKKLEV